MGITRRNVKKGNPRREPRGSRVSSAEKGKRQPPLPPGYKASQYKWLPEYGIYVPKNYSGTPTSVRSTKEPQDDSREERAA